jgi:hypothetical protein
MGRREKVGLATVVVTVLGIGMAAWQPDLAGAFFQVAGGYGIEAVPPAGLTPDLGSLMRRDGLVGQLGGFLFAFVGVLTIGRTVERYR